MCVLCGVWGCGVWRGGVVSCVCVVCGVVRARVCVSCIIIIDIDKSVVTPGRGARAV